jgi:hypothetical protein
MAKRIIDPKNIHAHYLFDLHEKCRLYAEFSHFFYSSGRGKNSTQDVLSAPVLNIETNLSHSTSKKLKNGINSVISFRVDEREIEGKIGFVDKEKDFLYFTLWFPFNIVNHIHMSFISSTPRSITLSGFEIYRRHASLTGIHITDNYDPENY